jgi:2-hydroxychromene-2-carboxylate isomerase
VEVIRGNDQLEQSARARVQPVFYYDLGDPECYLAAERIMSALPVASEWEPVLAAELGGPIRSRDAREIEQRALELGIQPVRWPRRWPPDTRTAMLAATYAKRIGRGVAFALAAFRQAFAAGRDLSNPETVLIAGAACEMHPAALLKGIGTRSVSEALEEATRRGTRAGVAELPAIEVCGAVFSGEGAIAEAARALR